MWGARFTQQWVDCIRQERWSSRSRTRTAGTVCLTRCWYVHECPNGLHEAILSVLCTFTLVSRIIPDNPQLFLFPFVVKFYAERGFPFFIDRSRFLSKIDRQSAGRLRPSFRQRLGFDLVAYKLIKEPELLFDTCRKSLSLSNELKCRETRALRIMVAT